MSCEGWVESKLSGIIDFDPKETLKKGVATKKVAMENVQPFTRKISGSTLELYNGGSKFRDGDTILARITPCLENGKTALVSDLGGGLYFGSTEFIVMRAKKGKADWKYVYYLATSQEVRDVAIKSMVGTSGRQRAQKDVIENFVTNIPPLPEQRSIARILSSLDDKIELNNRMNKTLEEIAQTIFKRWFVDFEFPDENGNPYKSSGGKMVESELGLIPEGWRVKCLYDFAQYINGTSFKKEEIQPVGVPIIKIAEIKNGISNTTNRFAGEKDKKYYLKRGDILFSWSGNPDTSIGIYVWPYDEKSVLNQHIFKVKTSDEMLVFTYFLLNYFMPQFAEIARNKQTTGLGHVTVADLKRMQHVYSTQNIFKLFDEIVGPIFDRYKQNIYENQYLTQLRDTLLPKFMSGEIRIPVMEETN